MNVNVPSRRGKGDRVWKIVLGSNIRAGERVRASATWLETRKLRACQTLFRRPRSALFRYRWHCTRGATTHSLVARQTTGDRRDSAKKATSALLIRGSERGARPFRMIARFYVFIGRRRKTGSGLFTAPPTFLSLIGIRFAACACRAR